MHRQTNWIAVIAIAKLRERGALSRFEAGEQHQVVGHILDPADLEGPDYPSETFRVLKNNEKARYGEYRTARLVLAAWDAQDAQPIAAQ